jgi:hypothetical protein
MTDLHWALIAIGVALLAALWGYGRWQERRELARLEASVRQGVGDPLAAPRTGRIEPRLEARSDGRVEPRLEIPEGGAALEAAVAPSGLEVAPATAGDGVEREASAYALPDGWAEDPLLDHVIELRCTHAIDGVAAIEARGQLERLQLPLPAHLAVWDARAQHWTAPDRFGFYTELLAAVQLADRRGVLGEIDASRFLAAVQQIALAVDADVDLPDARALVAQAAELDALTGRFDVQIAVTLDANAGPWTADAVQAAAAPLGFTAGGAGRWELRDDATALLLVLGAATLPTTRLTLTLDVPLVPPSAEPLTRQYTAAEALAARLDARIVDDNGRPVPSEAHLAVAPQLAALHEQMRAAGVEAGSLRAQRLYG